MAEIGLMVIDIVVCLMAGIYRLLCSCEAAKEIFGYVGIAQTTGSQEFQADRAQAAESSAGILAVLGDGIGKGNRGRLCAQLAVDTVLDRYEPYCVLNNPDYFFRTAFMEANRRIQMTLEDRSGGVSLGAVFLNRAYLYYALAGNIRIGLLRGEELIPLSRGQTVNILAMDAWKQGKITRQDALWSMEEKRLWNYVGMDGFHEIETCGQPVRLKAGDMILMASKGIFEELSWGEIEDILIGRVDAQRAAEDIIRAVEEKENPGKDNGTVVLLKIRMGVI